MNETSKRGQVKVRRLGRNGYLHGVVPLLDSAGNVTERIVRPLMLEFRARDVMQTIIGSALLAIPVTYTEEAWDLGASLPAGSIFAIAFLSLMFIATFVYFNFYKGYLKGYFAQFLLRVVGTYLISFCVVALMLTIIQVAPWGVDNWLAFKRVVVVAFPASMAATVTDSLK